MTERLPAPKPIPDNEWTKNEVDRGETFPQHITPLRSRIRTPEQEEVYTELTEQCNVLSQELFERWPEPWNLTREQYNEILLRYEVAFTNMASQARVLADSYRKFDVGAVALGYQDSRVPGPRTAPPQYPSDERSNPWRILFDANTRPETDEGMVAYGRKRNGTEKQSDVRKYCAELYLTDRIDSNKPEWGLPEEKLAKTIGMFVVGEAQIDNDSLVNQVSLTSCKLCRDRFWKKTLPEDDEGKKQTPVFEPDMPVISADCRNLNSRKWQPIKDLHTFHKERRPSNNFDID